MTVGLLLVCHEHLGRVMLDTARSLLPDLPMPVAVLDVPNDADPDALGREAARLSDRLDSGDGVLVLTDVYGATPANIACNLFDGRRIALVAGLNLPMLLRVLNYPGLGLDELREKALGGGRSGIIESVPDDRQ